MFIPIAVTSLAVLAAVQGVAWLFGVLVGETEVGGLVGPAGADAPIKDLITSIGQPLGFAVGAGAVIAHLCLLDRGSDSGVDRLLPADVQPLLADRLRPARRQPC